MESLTGQTIDGYLIHEMIGGGGSSELYRATAPDRSNVAIKFLRGDFTEALDLRKRFEREIALLQAVKHPHIIPVLAAGYADYHIYLVMPFVAGYDLYRVLESHRFSPLDVWRFLEPICGALAAGHAHNIIHRDLKPENILVANPNDNPHYYLADFGLAKRPGIDETLTRVGMTVGTAYYISPEAIMGEAHTDTRADIYSLAVMTYELLLGDLPFLGSVVAVALAHARQAPPALTTRQPKFPPAIDAVVMKSLAKKRTERHQTILEFAEAYHQALNSLPVEQQTATYWLK